MKTLHYFIFLLIALTVSAEARIWTAKTGHTIDGEFVTIEDENVAIKLSDGKPAKIKLDLLLDEDQQFAQDEMRKKENPSPFIIDDSPFIIEGVSQDAKEVRTWTAKTGHTIDGAFVILEVETVVIQLSDGKQAKVKFDLLSDEDRQFVQNEMKKKENPSPFIIDDSPVVLDKSGFNTPRDVLEQETQKGNLEALYCLARCYSQGWNGCPKDEKKADELYQRGSQLADTGNPFAQCCRAVCHGKGIGVPQDEAEAVKWLRKAAEQGNAAGQSRLGTCYAQGMGVPQDEAEAVKWLRKAAEQGFAEAQCALGLCYAEGKGVPADAAEAAKWFLKSAEQGFAPAQHLIGICYDNGEGVRQDEAETVKWYLKAAEQEIPPAQYSLGLCYVNGTGVPEDMAEAAKWFRKAAEQGFAPAQYMLGICYYHGHGVPEDKAEGRKWLRKSAEQGFGKAIEMLGQLEDDKGKGDELGNAEELFRFGLSYYRGEDVPQDREKAVQYFRKSAELGYDKGQNWLGICYQTGQGVPKDSEEAVKWFCKSAEQGFADAQFNLGFLYIQGEGVPQDMEEAAKWFRKAADQDDAKSQFMLAMCYFGGEGVPENPEKAVEWLRKAAEQGGAEAQSLLGKCLLKGVGVLQNPEEAIEWFRKAAEQDNVDAQTYLGACYVFGTGVPKDKEEAIKWLRKAAEQGNEEALELLRKIEEGDSTDSLLIELKGHTSDVRYANFSPDGKKIVTESWFDETVRIWDAESGKELRKLEMRTSSYGALFSPDSKKFITVELDNPATTTVRVLDADSGRELRKQVLGMAVEVSANRKKVIALSSANKSNHSEGLRENVQIWDVDSGQLLTVKPRGAAIAGELFALPGWYPGFQTGVSPDGTKIVSVRLDVKGEKSFVQVWDANSGRELRTLGGVPVPGRQKPEIVSTAIFSRDGSLLALHGSYVGIWDVQSGRELQRLYGYTGDFSPDGTKFATVGLDDAEKNYTVHIWDVKTGKKLATLGIEGKLVENVLFSPDGKKIVAHCLGSDDEAGLIQAFDADSGRKLFELEDFPVCFSSDSRTMAIEDFGNDGVIQFSDSENCGVRILDAESGKELKRLKGRFGEFSPDGKKIATISDDTVRVWDLSAADTQPVTKDGSQTYRDREYSFSFTYPENWNIHPDPASMGAHVAVIGQRDGGFTPIVTTGLQPPDKDILKTTKEDMQKNLDENFQNVKIIDYRTKQLGGKECLFCHYQGTTDGLHFEFFQIYFLHKDKTLIVTICDSQANFGKHRPVFDSIVSSFRFD